MVILYNETVKFPKAALEQIFDQNNTVYNLINFQFVYLMFEPTDIFFPLSCVQGTTAILKNNDQIDTVYILLKRYIYIV